MSPLGNEDARAQVGTICPRCGSPLKSERAVDKRIDVCTHSWHQEGGLSQRWHEDNSPEPDGRFGAGQLACAKQLDAAKLRIEEAVKALPHDTFMDGLTFKEYERHREDCRMCAMLKIIREIL